MSTNKNLNETTINNARIIQRDGNCRKTIAEAIETLSIVTRTLGPGGLPIFIERKKLPPLTTKDGVSVAKEIYHPDRSVNTLVQSIKEASIKTNDEAGDGTTTAILLTQAIYTEAMKFIEAGTCQPNDLVYELVDAEKDVLDFIDTQVNDISKSEDRLYDVAYISCNGDRVIADVVVRAFKEVGEDGVITVDEGSSPEATLRIEEGYQFNRGVDAFGNLANAFLTNETEQEAVLHDCKILLYAGDISDVNQLAQCLQSIATGGKDGAAIRMPNLAIIAYDFKGPAIQMLAQNRVQAGLPLLPIRMVSCGTNSQENMMRDLAVLTGATVIVPSHRHLGTATIEDLGSVDKVVGTMRRKTTLFGPHGNPEEIMARMEVLKKQMDDAEHQYDKDNIRERIGRLVGGIAVIGIGGSSDLERKERKHRVEDAIHATKDALESGVVAGGGATLLKASSHLENTGIKTNGRKVLANALTWPMRQVLNNAGLKTDFIMTSILMGEGETYDARKKAFLANALEGGVIDPVKVVKSSLVNSLSIARELIKAGGVISFVKQPELDDQYHNLDE